ncbi:hypothetical protein BWZ22_11340 [Seonamhaeicola sp. S2-3]|nr:hypothetical protein BWZ22_11340 [Seonamhaeicola sp. S2-3]
MLPNERKAERTAIFSTSPESIFNLITDNRNWKWRSNLKEVQILESAGDNEIFKEIQKKGQAITFKVKSKIPYSRYEIEIIEANGFTGYWTGTLEETDNGGTELTFTEYATIKNPFIKVLSYLFFDLGSTIDQYLGDIAKAIGEEYNKHASDQQK